MALEESSGILMWENLEWDPSEGSDWLWRDLYVANLSMGFGQSPQGGIFRILHGKRTTDLDVLVGSGRVHLGSPRFIGGLFGCLRILGDTPV